MTPLVNCTFLILNFALWRSVCIHQAIPQISRPVWYKHVYMEALFVPSVRHYMLKWSPAQSGSEILQQTFNNTLCWLSSTSTHLIYPWMHSSREKRGRRTDFLNAENTTDSFSGYTFDLRGKIVLYVSSDVQQVQPFMFHDLERFQCACLALCTSWKLKTFWNSLQSHFLHITIFWEKRSPVLWHPFIICPLLPSSVVFSYLTQKQNTDLKELQHVLMNINLYS